MTKRIGSGMEDVQGACADVLVAEQGYVLGDRLDHVSIGVGVGGKDLAKAWRLT
jgi:hypothetical protein